MRHIVMLPLAVLVAVAAPAGATTILASAPLFSTSAVNLQCEVVNIGTKPVPIASAKVLGDFGNVTSFDNCTGTLLPATTCVFTSNTGATNTNPYGVLTVSGSVKTLRGQCALYNGSSQTVSSPLR